MKIKSNVVTLATTFVASLLSFNAFAVDVQLADKKWDGNIVPEGQQCQKFGGIEPSTPRLLVTNIPNGTDALLFEYSDRDSERMNNGGHGKIQFALQGKTIQAAIDSVPGHTFEMPDGVTMIAAHAGPGWDKAGAYMPPCSGGKDHQYYVTVKAMDGDKTLDSTVLELGKY